MASKKTTRRALFSSIVSLILCCAMLVGTTFAWFTDTVTISGNKIQSGTLDIELHELVDGKWEDISDSTEALFDYDKWEPGYTDATVLKVVNAGTLALKWAATITPLEATNVSDLADAIDVYIKEGVSEAPDNFEEVKGNYTRAGTLREFMGGFAEKTVGELTAKQEATLGIVLHMQEEADNKYQGLALGSEFDIRIYATQLENESDSFGTDYDAGAKYPANYEVVKTVDVAASGEAHVITTDTTVTAGSDANAVVSNASVTVPAGATVDSAKVEDNKIDLTVSIETNPEVPANIEVEDDKNVVPLIIDVEGLAEENEKLVIVSLNIGAGRTGLEIFHTEDGENKAMTLLAAGATPAHNTYTYNAETGELVLYAHSFSPFTIIFDGTPVVKDEAELKQAIAAGGVVKLGADFAIKDTITVSGTVVLELNGHTLDASSNVSRPFWITESANLTINGNGTVKCGAYGLVDVREGATSAKITLNGGTYTANTDNGAFIKPRSGNVTVNLNDVTYTDTSDDGFIMGIFDGSGAAYENLDLTLTIDGGKYSANAGIGGFEEVTVKNAEITTRGVAFEICGNATIENCKITVDPGSMVHTAPGCAIAASNEGVVTVKDTELTGNMHAALECYTTGGTIIAENVTFSGATFTNDLNNNPYYIYDKAADSSSIIVDGARVVSSTAQLKAALANKETTKVVLAAGNYKADLYNIDARDSLTIIGQGTDTRVAFANLQVRASQFEELTISNCTIERMPEKDWGHLVFGSSTKPGGVYTISNCTFNGVDSQGIFINQTVAATFNIENCTFNGDFGGEGAITIQNNNGVDITVNVTGCDFNDLPETSHEIFVHYAYNGWTLNAENITPYWKPAK